MNDAVNLGDGFNNVVNNHDHQSSIYVSDFSAAFVDFLYKNRFKQDEIDLIANQSYQLFVPGYAPVKLDGHQHPQFRPVLFMNRREIGSLLVAIENIVKKTNAFDRRLGLVEAWKEVVLKDHIGDISSEQIESMSLERISELVFGIPSVSELSKVALKDLLDDAVVDDLQVNRYIDHVLKKESRLDYIFNTNHYPYSFMSNFVTYYWIEQDLLP